MNKIRCFIMGVPSVKGIGSPEGPSRRRLAKHTDHTGEPRTPNGFREAPQNFQKHPRRGNERRKLQHCSLATFLQCILEFVSLKASYLFRKNAELEKAFEAGDDFIRFLQFYVLNNIKTMVRLRLRLRFCFA